MLTDPSDPPPYSQPGTSSPRTDEEVHDQFEANRGKLRGLVRDMDQEVADSEQRQSDRRIHNRGPG